MYRLFANGTVNAAVVGYGPPLFLFHSLLSDRTSFDAVAFELSQSYRVIIPELPGFGRSQAVRGGLTEIADRMAEAVEDAAGGRDAIANGRGPRPSAGRPPIPSPGSTSDRIGALVGAFGHARYLNVPGENLSPAVTATARRTPIGRTRMRSLLEAADIARPLSAPPENPLTLGRDLDHVCLRA